MNPLTKNSVLNPHYYGIYKEEKKNVIYKLRGFGNDISLLSGMLKVKKHSLHPDSEKLFLQIRGRDQKLWVQLEAIRHEDSDMFFVVTKTNDPIRNSILVFDFLNSHRMLTVNIAFYDFPLEKSEDLSIN